VARHTYGGPRRVLLESDDPRTIAKLRKIDPSLEFVQLPRCLFDSIGSKAGQHVRSNLQKSPSSGSLESNSLQATSNPVPLAADWTAGQLKACEERRHLSVHDEGALIIATMELLSEGWPIVGAMRSSMFR